MANSIFTPKRIIVAGYARHGKDTVSEYLRDHYNLSFTSSSEMAARLFLYEKLKAKYGYKTFEECYEDRMNHREEWFVEIQNYNTPDKTNLAQKIFQAHPVYCGIRCGIELAAIKAKMDVIVLWVNADKRRPPEPKNSMTITAADAHTEIDNNGTQEELCAYLGSHEFQKIIGI